ncbi:MAG: hypothetical protein HYV97_04505 [Bdellovibrio sp.]|nr:hypothetical protein [Bdellovibrio sp.]
MLKKADGLLKMKAQKKKTRFNLLEFETAGLCDITRVNQARIRGIKPLYATNSSYFGYSYSASFDGEL